MTTAVEKFEEFNKFGILLGLDRIRELLRRLGDPQKEGKYIHITGTNGKGSVSKYLEKGLASCGYKVGLYTSPYIEKFNERIQCGGEMISDEDLERIGNMALAKAEEMVKDGLDSPTEFEVVMATAFLYFKEQAPDIVILEAGMGGIGDATNVIDKPLVSVFTNVTFDHMHALGNTLEAIATDKAGIIKEGCPVVSNVDIREPAVVIAKTAYEKGCRLYDTSKIKCTIDWQTPLEQQVSMELWYTDYSEVITSMVGKHQAENVKTALAVIEVLRKDQKIKVERSALYKGIREAVQPGRFEVLRGRDGEKPYVIIDGAHNDAGGASVANAVKSLFPDSKTLVVAGMVSNKEIDKVVSHFAEIADGFIATAPDYDERKLEAADLAEHITNVLEEFEKKGEGRGAKVIAVADTPSQSVELALNVKDDYDVILFAGSLYLIGEIRSIFSKNTDYDYDRTLKYGNRK